MSMSASRIRRTIAATPDRFRPAAGASWSRNRSYLFPGWHVFKDARFAAAKLKPAPAAMRLFIPGAKGRDYVSALAPETREALSPYEKLPTPVLVIRQHGEAWDRPFAVIYEPRSPIATPGTDGI